MEEQAYSALFSGLFFFIIFEPFLIHTGKAILKPKKPKFWRMLLLITGIFTFVALFFRIALIAMDAQSVFNELSGISFTIINTLATIILYSPIIMMLTPFITALLIIVIRIIKLSMLKHSSHKDLNNVENYWNDNMNE